MPVVVTAEEWNRLQKRIEKEKGGNHRPLRMFESRFLFLRYKKDGGHRVKRLEIKNRISGAGVQSEVVVKFRMLSSEKSEQKRGIALELGPGRLEPLLTKALEHLKASPGELNYYWEDVE